jgi:hypothetical protein
VLVILVAGLFVGQLLAAPAIRAAGLVTVGASTTGGSTSATTTVALSRPAGLVDGDVLIAQITADGAPSITGTPTGWSPVISPLAVGSSARVFAYYRVVPGAAAEPASYTWRLSTSVRWNGGMTAFHGVDRTTPFDSVAHTRVNTSTSTTVAVSGVTTTTAGALLVGGVGPNSPSASVTPPTGWTELLESRGGQTAELAYQPRPTAGATGTATWRLSSSNTAAGWLRALRPAATTGPAPDTAPPSTPTSASATADGPQQVTVRWTASTDNVGVASSLSTAVKWNAGVENFHGVDPANPWDTAASGATSASATTLTVPGVTTTTPGAMLVGGVGLNSTTGTATPPSGWTELGEPTGAQDTVLAGQARPTAGGTGNATWTFSSSLTSTGWLRALKPG